MKLEERIDAARIRACARTDASSPFLYYTFFRPGQRHSIIQVLVEVLHLERANYVQVPLLGWQVLLERGPVSGDFYKAIERRVASEIGEGVLVVRETCPLETVAVKRVGELLNLYEERTCARVAGTGSYVNLRKGKISYV